jgi:hypothetical protein
VGYKQQRFPENEIAAAPRLARGRSHSYHFCYVYVENPGKFLVTRIYLPLKINIENFIILRKSRERQTFRKVGAQSYGSKRPEGRKIAELPKSSMVWFYRPLGQFGSGVFSLLNVGGIAVNPVDTNATETTRSTPWSG